VKQARDSRQEQDYDSKVKQKPPGRGQARVIESKFLLAKCGCELNVLDESKATQCPGSIEQFGGVQT